MLKTILVPLDGSELAERALPYAIALARDGKGRLVLVRAATVHTFPGADPTSAQIAVMQEAESELKRVAERLRAEGLEVQEAAYYDEATPAIVDAARFRHADLIVMSTHGRSGFGRWVYGSVAEDVLRHADKPVLLVPAACARNWVARPDNRLRRVLVPLDGSEFAEEALGPARELARLLQAELLLLRVAEPVAYSYAGSGVFPPTELDIEPTLAEAHRYLEAVASRLETTECPISIETRDSTGFAGAAIAEFARNRAVDAIAMATHGRGGVARLVMGSVASAVLQGVGVPVLLIRPAAVRHETVEDFDVTIPASSESAWPDA